MNDRLALQGLGATLVIIVLTLAIFAALVAAGVTAVIVPQPDSPAEQLVTAIGAHNYEGAVDQLSEELQKQVSEDDLKNIAEAIESSHQGIDQASGQSSEEQEETATAQVQVKFEDQTEKTVDFSLVKENGIWKVSSIGPLQSLAQ